MADARALVVPAASSCRRRRRCAAALAPLLLILTSARAACGCGNAANGYQMPGAKSTADKDLPQAVQDRLARADKIERESRERD